MLPRGFLGSRADVLMDIVLIGIVATPFLLLIAFRWAKQKKFIAHRTLQLSLLSVLLLTVIAFETDIRISGGSKEFLHGSPFADSVFLRIFLNLHIAIAVTSFLGWIWLVKISWPLYTVSLPGQFSINHKRYGYYVFSGVFATAVTGAALYIFAFVL